MQRFLNIRDRPAHIQQHAVGVRGGHLQSIGLGEGDNRLIILFRRTESFSKFLRCQVTMIIGAGRIVDLPQRGPRELQGKDECGDGQETIEKPVGFGLLPMQPVGRRGLHSTCLSRKARLSTHAEK